MKINRGNEHLNQLGEDLRTLLEELPETISLDDVMHHDWLRRLVLAADDLTNRVEYRATDWCKTKGYPE